MRVLPTRIHGVVDYLWGLTLLAVPWALGFADWSAAHWTALAFGAGAILYSLVTDYELGAAPILSMPLHLAVDGFGGAFLVASPWLLGFADRIAWPHVAFGLFSVAAGLITRKLPERGPRLRRA